MVFQLVLNTKCLQVLLIIFQTKFLMEQLKEIKDLTEDETKRLKREIKFFKNDVGYL